MNQEKKYKVQGFDAIQRQLTELGSKPGSQSESTHYYAPRSDNNVVKLVANSSGFEIHELTENDGRFQLTRREQVASLGDGLK